MNAEPVEVVTYEKNVEGRRVTCDIERFEDGSVGVYGDEIDTWMFEFTSDALERAIAQVESEGYTRSADSHAATNDVTEGER